MSLLPSPVFREHGSSTMSASATISDTENTPPNHAAALDHEDNKENEFPGVVDPFGGGPIIYIDPDARYERPSSPGTLHLETLSLIDRAAQPQPLTVLQAQSVVQDTRASMVVMHKGFFANLYPIIHPHEVIVGCAKGRLYIKANMHALRAESAIFAGMLDLQPLALAQTRVLTLRGDFTPAVNVLLSFIEHDSYILHPSVRAMCPTFTLLDLHVHAYKIGYKYEVARLCAHAVSEYVIIARMVLSLDFPSNFAPAHEQSEQDAEAKGMVACFLDSVVLAWKGTYSGVDDSLRAAVVDLVKAHVAKLVGLKYFGVMMAELGGFREEVARGFKEDGVEVVVRGGEAPGLYFA